jgi:hypothetical protein
MAAGGAHESTSVIVLTAEPRTPVGLTHRLKLMLGPTGWIATAFHDPHLAFAELCLRERAQASRAAWGLQRVEKNSMVIVDPLRWPAVNDLVAAIKRYSPSVAVWAYRDGQLQAVAAPQAQSASPTDHAMTVMDADDEQESTAAQSMETAPRLATTSRTPLRLAGADDGDEEQFSPSSGDSSMDEPNGHGGGSAASSATVTREEIDLLLKRSTDSPSTSGGSAGIPA